VTTSAPLNAVAPHELNSAATKIGFTLSAEEFAGPDLLKHARAAEDAGFDFLMISDHFHPWVEAQGNSPFVWGVLGALSGATDEIPVGTGVTCPTTRIHPAIIAQAAATAADLLPGRFFLGVGSGERLNEHIVGQHWPDNSTRLDQLAEAVELIQELWEGSMVSHRGEYFTLDRAKIYSLPAELPPIFLAAGGPESATLAAKLGQGLIGVAPDDELIETYAGAADPPGPRVGQIQFCFGESFDAALDIALEHWPNAAFGGNLSQEIALPSDFESAAELVTKETLAENLTAGNDPDEFVAALNTYLSAGYDHIYIHQIGPDQLGAIEFFSQEVIPAFRNQPGPRHEKAAISATA
jgi:coenzyme F420-dependent glucose-6-phosphate dehydrogenase